MKKKIFVKNIQNGIPDKLPPKKKYNKSLNHAPSRKHNLSGKEKQLAIKNALRYFSKNHHTILAKEFKKELDDFGKIYMYRFKPNYKIKARHIDKFPHKSKQAASIMFMISNNLDTAVAQHPD